MATVDLKSGSEAPGAAGEIEESSGLAMALHELDAFERFEGADEDSGGDSGGLAHDIEHEVRAIIEKNVGMSGVEVHRTNARSRAAEMMSGGIAGRIFHNAAAEAARGEIVDDNSSDEEASEIDGVRWKLSAAEAADGEFRW